ncbi:nucleolar protein 6-like [Camellia sinensis]|uniref:nucleolar protein 6-like n=1 Tax=Camellia sinensis TaxID=4442 RepID=UPI0010362DB4|nr:nucleolar protein 6-like [Camellia sinensis]
MERNNVRALNQGGVLQATPKYNSSILEDLFLEDNAEFVRRTFLGWKELGEALILLKVWAQQRSSRYAHDCLSGFLISVIMVYLTTKSGGKCINNSMNTMQIFRVTMDFIGMCSFSFFPLLFRS